MASPLTQADLKFPTQSVSISSTLSSLKRSALSITNRLNSITSDSEFVKSVSEAYDLPLVANERCGSWYIPPEEKAESVYFKSTDGHTNEWSFSLRRLNFQVLDVVSNHGGCVIVDSTRRGKSMPDALLKTIPIWCCVMNRALFHDSGPHELYTPPQAVSESEHAQIETRLDRFFRQFIDICKPNISQLRSKIQKPLRPIWVTQTSSLPEIQPSFPSFHPVVLCTASRRVHGAEASEGGYIQGAADDHEAWAHGLTPQIFWSNKEKLLSTNEEDLPSLIAQLLKAEKGPDAAPILVRPTTNLYISTTQNLDVSPFDIIISCTTEPLTITNAEHVKTKKYLHLRCQTGKLGSRDLRIQLTHLPSLFFSLPTPPGKILVCCPTGKDLSVGVALAILCLYTNDEGVVSDHQTGRKIDKTFIKQRLAWLTTTSPTLNPPRGTLQSVNAFLMPSPSAPQPDPMEPPIRKLVLLNQPGTEKASSTDQEMQTTDPDPISTTQKPLPNSTAIFASLQNDSKPWTFTRTLSPTLPTHPSGTVTGTATFTPYNPPSSSSPLPPTPTLLYAEEGEFTTTTGLRFTARRKYIYQLKPSPSSSPSPDTNSELYIAVHFHEEDKGKEAIGGLFVEMGELGKGDSGVLEARNREQHLCAEDLYTASWKFGRGMVEGVDVDGEGKEEKWWEVRYDVKGPKKDYVSETKYSRG